MTSVHCSKVATVYEEEKPPSRVKEMEREIIRYSSPIQPWYVPERQPLSLQLSSFLRSRERRAFEGNPDFPSAATRRSSNFFFVVSFFFLFLLLRVSKFIPLYRTKMFDKLDNCFLLSGGEESWSDKSNVGSKKEFCIDVVSDYLYNWMISIHVFNLFNNHDLEIWR